VAKKVLLNCFVEINSVDRTASVSKVELDDTFEEKETTTYGDDGAKRVLAGLESGSVGITFKNDFAAAALDSAMWALRRSVVSFKARTEKDLVVSSANPQYECDILIGGWKPISGSVGDVAEVDISFTMDGAMSRVETT
jgi:hypothetical protein